MLYSDNCLSIDNLSLLATAHVCVGVDRSESITYALLSGLGEVVTVGCNTARLDLSAATKNSAIGTSKWLFETHEDKSSKQSLRTRIKFKPVLSLVVPVFKNCPHRVGP